jgi:hypothetical protein
MIDTKVRGIILKLISRSYKHLKMNSQDSKAIYKFVKNK